MKASEHKIKQTMQFNEIPGCLRRLAAALEKKMDDHPSEFSSLPDAITKFKIKAKDREIHWEMKIKIKAEANPAQGKKLEADKTETHVSGNPEDGYKQLKKRMKSSFKNIGESLATQTWPQPEIVEIFLSDSKQMIAFPGEAYGAPCYPAYREGCRQLAEAYESGNQQDFKAAYARLGQLKKDCHDTYK